MGHIIKLYLIVLPIFFLIDFSWLGFVAVKLYKSELGGLARLSGDSLTPVWWAAVLVYLLIPLGIIMFALPRVSTENIFPAALLWGALFGGILYAVYDLTNYAMLAEWPLRLTWIDIVWGCVLCGSVSQIAAIIRRLLM